MFTDDTRSILGAAEFPGNTPVECLNLPATGVTGIIQTMDRLVPAFYSRLPQRGFDLTGYENAVARVHLCTYCGRGNSLIGVILCAIMVPLGLSMYPLALRLRRNFG